MHNKYFGATINGLHSGNSFRISRLEDLFLFFQLSVLDIHNGEKTKVREEVKPSIITQDGFCFVSLFIRPFK